MPIIRSSFSHKTSFLPLVFALPLSSCGTAQKAQPEIAKFSSGYTGCPPQENRVTDVELGNVSTWTVECRGKRFFCSMGSSHNTGIARLVRPRSHPKGEMILDLSESSQI